MTLSSLSHLQSLHKEQFDKILRSRCWEKLQHYQLTNIQLSKLALELDKERTTQNTDEVSVWHPINIGIISSGNSSLTIPSIIGTGVKCGFSINVIDFSNTHPFSFLSQHHKKLQDKKYDYFLIAFNYEDIQFLDAVVPGSDALNTVIKKFICEISKLTSILIKNTGAKIIIQNIPSKPHCLFGHLDARVSVSEKFQLQLFNQSIVSNININQCYLFDVARIAENEGLNNWYDERMWYLGKFPFSINYLPLYADHLCRILKSIKGSSHKCIVLDLDNTLWGGIVGQDGLEGINLDIGDPEGEAFIAFQRYLLQLKNRGIILAVCSKNNEKDVIEVFLKKPNMLIKLDDIACFVANWDNKPSNIKVIAKTLNIGLDSIVFIDDTPLEREHVRRYLPSVAVPEMPDDPALYVRVLSQAGYFELSNYTEVDQVRNESYQHNIKVKQILSQSIDIQEGLASINMQLYFKPFDSIGRNRIEQLINKTNQFNLTTKRYDSNQIKRFENDKQYYTLQTSLSDKFGDYGMISVLIGFIKNATITIDTWLMSCRAIGRDVERAVFQELVNYCFDKKIDVIFGKYIENEQNTLVKNLYYNLGFLQASLNTPNIWRFDINKKVEAKLPFKITRQSE